MLKEWSSLSPTPAKQHTHYPRERERVGTLREDPSEKLRICLSQCNCTPFVQGNSTHTHTQCVSVLPATGAIWCATYVSLTYTYACTYIKYNHRYSGRCRTLMIMMCICFSASGTISATRLGALRADSDTIRKGKWNKTEAKVFQLHWYIKTKESSSKWYVVY